MDNASWGALALALSALAGVWTWYAMRRRRWASGVRGMAVTLLPIAAYLTHTLKMFGRIGDAIGDWAAGLVFSPVVWIGVVVAALAVLLFVISFRLPGGSSKKAARDGASGQETAKIRPRSRRASGDDGSGDDFDDIQAILRKHGIS